MLSGISTSHIFKIWLGANSAGQGMMLTLRPVHAADRCYDCRTDLILMSEEQLKTFLAKAKDDQSIQDKLKAAKTPEDVVSIAKEHGHEFTADKFTELSEEELEGVAGGVVSVGLGSRK